MIYVLEKGRAIQMTTPLAYSVAIPRSPERYDSVRQVYRTKKSFVAVHFDPDGKGEIGFLPEGAKLRVLGPSSCLREGVEVVFEEQVYNIFKVDLFARCGQFAPRGARGRAVTSRAQYDERD
jgi:hypothetical protein